MKKNITLFVIAILWGSQSFSQIKKNNGYLEIECGIGLSEFNSEKYNGFFKLDLKRHHLSTGADNYNSPGIVYAAVSYFRGRFGHSVRFYQGEWGYYTPKEHEFHGVNALEYLLKFRLIKSKIIHPYFFIGAGWRAVSYSQNMISGDGNYFNRYYVDELNFPMGLSIGVKLRGRFGAIYQGSINYANGNINTLNQTLGLTLNLSKKKMGYIKCPSL